MDDRMAKLEAGQMSLVRLYAQTNIALNAILLAISKQDGIDKAKLTADVSQALLMHQVSSESRAEGISSAGPNDYQMIRLGLRAALPDLPIEPRPSVSS